MKPLTVVIRCALILFAFGAISRGQDNRPTPCPRPNYILDRFASFGGTSLELEKAILDNFAIELHNAPDEIGYLIVYAGRRTCAGDAQARGMRMKKYLVEYRGVEWNRVIWKDAGYLDEPYILLETQLRGTPCPYPYDYPITLDRKDVQIMKCNATPPKRKKTR
jgi:hypothetical protein